MNIQEREEQLKSCQEKIAGLNEKIESGYTDLGRAVYAAYKTDLSDSAAREIAETIAGAENEIRETETEIQRLQDLHLCGQCGQEVKATDAFCPHCGTRINTEVAAKETAGKAFCPFCGEKVEAGQAFCSVCGGHLEIVAAVPEAQAAEPVSEEPAAEDQTPEVQEAADLPQVDDADDDMPAAEMQAPAEWPEEEEEEIPEEDLPETDPDEMLSDFTPEDTATQFAEENIPVQGVVICQNCGQELTADDAFCYNCGQKVVHADAAPAADPEPAPEAAEGHRCPNCGTPAEADQLFCMECGTRLG